MPTEKPHRPAPLTTHDPYPATDPDTVDPLAGRRANSTGYTDVLAADLAALPDQPSHVTRTVATPRGCAINHDDGYGTTIRVEKSDTVGRFVLEVASLGDTVRVELPLSVANVLDEVIRNVADLTLAAPITGSR